MGARDVMAKLAVGLCLLVAAPTNAGAQGVAQPPPAQQPMTSMQPSQPAPPVVNEAASAAATAAPATAPGADQSYILGPDDVVELEVLGRADFRVRAKIGQDGAILLPYLGSVQASNRTTQQLSDEVSRALAAGGFFARPILRVEVVSFSSRYVTVLGAVANPGLVPINKPYRLSEILARVGGINPSGADYIIVRSEQGPEKRLSIKALVTGDVSQDPLVSPGDKIFLPQAEVFYVTGQVKSPGSFSLGIDMTLRMAIAKAGGLTELGSQRRVKITRGGQKVRIDLDDKIEAGDVIDVGERIF